MKNLRINKRVHRERTWTIFFSRKTLLLLVLKLLLLKLHAFFRGMGSISIFLQLPDFPPICRLKNPFGRQTCVISGSICQGPSIVTCLYGQKPMPALQQLRRNFPEANDCTIVHQEPMFLVIPPTERPSNDRCFGTCLKPFESHFSFVLMFVEPYWGWLLKGFYSFFFFQIACGHLIKLGMLSLIGPAWLQDP